MATASYGALIGYARTSTAEQDAGLEAQIRDLDAAGAARIFKEQVSSVDAKRTELDAALNFIREGDTLVVTKLDRLARSVADLISIEKRLRDKGVSLRILDLNIDTNTSTGRLTLNLIASIAQFEREIMLERQKEGIAKAKASGKYTGRKPTAMAKTDDVLDLHRKGVGVSKIAADLGISRRSVYRILKGAGVMCSKTDDVAS